MYILHFHQLIRVIKTNVTVATVHVQLCMLCKQRPVLLMML